jgi:hypothetical protein
LDGEAIGCGAIRPINKYTAEVKRMYTRNKGRGVGIQILSYLEKLGTELDYSVIWLETRLETEAVCFEKKQATE